MSGPVQFSFGNAEKSAPGAVQSDFGGGANEEMPEERAYVQVARPALRRPTPPAKPQNIKKLAKDRLKAVEKELRRLKALEKERDELKRLIAAAENVPRAIVRAIKSPTG